MTKFIKTTVASLAVASFLVAQPAAAATRSYQSLPHTGIQKSLGNDRAGAAIGDAENLRGRGGAVIGVLLIFAALLALFAAAGLFGNGKDSTG
ncbi:MAG: hypothetical protein ABIT09_11745 [Croceibacterium sp.]